MVRELFIGQFGGAGCYLADESTVEIFPVVSALFRNTTRSARKFLVVISDELGKSSGLSRIVSELKKNEITAYVLGVPGKQDAHEQLALQTGGEFWNILRTKGNQDFKQLLSNVADSVGREMKKQLEDGTVSSGTDLGAALGLLAVELHVEKMASRALPPIVVLLSDGRPTDDFRAALRNLEKQSWWKRSIRMAIAIGSDSVPEALREFIGTDQIPLLNASNPESLLRYIRWASTTVLRSMSCPSSVTSPNEQKPRVVIPEVPRFLAERFVDNNIW
ncbi:MAG: hypothetical protein JNM43_28990 [Planctomycetaceae bacterium]|nr:hypothetical protein [Planctomycetaceae bacterium]